jgi:hypothetical protein
MKLTKGIKPEKIIIPKGITYSVRTYQNGYVEIDIEEQTEIDKLKLRGFKE